MKYNLRSWNDLLDAAFPSEQFLVDPYLVRGGITFLFGPKSTGKCYGINDLVLSADGSTLPAGSVTPGHLVMGEDSTPRKVLEVHEGRGDMWEIHHTSGDTWTASGGHILTVEAPFGRRDRRAGKKWLEWRRVDVEVREFARWAAWKRASTHVIYKAVELPERQLPVEPWLLGVLLGDGGLGSSQLRLHNSADEILLPALDAFGRAGVGARVRERTNGARLITTTAGPDGHQIRAYLREVGLDVGAGFKYIPTPYLLSSLAQRLELLAGLLDTDGWQQGGDLGFCSKSPLLARGVVQLARSCGLRASTWRVEKYCQTGAGGEYHTVSITGDLSRIPLRCRRKMPEPRPRHKTGLSVRPIGEGEWVGFSVDGDHRHLLADYSLTHNSPLQWSWATSIGSGESWMGLPTSKGRALILEMDQPEGTVQKRVAAMGPKDGVWFLSGPPMNVPNVGQETLLELKRAREVAKPDVVFFNTLRQTTCLPLEDGTTARHVYAFAKEQFPGSALVFIHHPKKSPPSNVHIDEDEMFSGSNAWRNDAQVSLHLQKFLHKEKGKRKSTARLRHTGSQVSPLYRPLPLLLGRDGTSWSSPLVDELKALRALAFETDLTGGALDKEAVKKGLFASYATARRRRQMLEAGFGVSREWLGLERYEDEQEEAQEAEGGGEGGEQG